jgi:hypothetical protein
LVLASVPSGDKVCFQANFHMKAAEMSFPILEFQTAPQPWLLRLEVVAQLPHPHIPTHPESPSSPSSLALDFQLPWATILAWRQQLWTQGTTRFTFSEARGVRE